MNFHKLVLDMQGLMLMQAYSAGTINAFPTVQEATYMVQEFCAGGDLYSALRDDRPGRWHSWYRR